MDVTLSRRNALVATRSSGFSGGDSTTEDSSSSGTASDEMDSGFDLRRLAVNHVLVALWTYFLFPDNNPFSLLDGGISVGTGAILALWSVAVLGLLAIDAIVLFRTLSGGATDSDGEVE